MVNGELVAIRGRPHRKKSAHPEQGDASFRLYFHDFEAPLETVAERLEIVIEIVEHAFRIVELSRDREAPFGSIPRPRIVAPNSTAPLLITGRR